MITYAEQILMDKKTNQFFIQFGPDDEHVKQHFDWFSSYLVPVKKVASIGDLDDKTGFYHVGFTSMHDNRLALYIKVFENKNGESLHPESYQLFEWSYDAWIKQDGPEKFLDWFSNK